MNPFGILLGLGALSLSLLTPARSEAQGSAHGANVQASGSRATGARRLPFADVTDSLRLYYVGRPVGWEHYRWATHGDGTQLVADFDFVDRGRRNHMGATLSLGADMQPQSLEVARVTDSARTVTVRVDVQGDRATVLHNGAITQATLPAVAFALAPYQPVSQHLALVRYWLSHGRPLRLAVVPGDPLNAVTIKRSGLDTLANAGAPLVLTRYSIDGVVWGLEYLWLDADGRLAMFASAAGGLSFKAVRAALVPSVEALMEVASRAAMVDLVAVSHRTSPIARGAVAFVGATLVDGTGSAAVPNATVVVVQGRIVAAGPSAGITVPANARRIDVRGQTIIPGLWDSHAHLHQLEWVPVYLAAGITTVRDMGNELSFLTAMRRTVTSGRAYGPTILAAGLIDGPGPNAFGALSAETPDEGRAIVRRYHALGFEQMKLYSLLSPAVVGAVCDEAHKLGMTVTGHIPTSLTLLAAVDSGMDQVAHQPIRGELGSDSLQRTIAYLARKGTVVDPTSSWGEIGGHAQSEPLQSFQPVTALLPVTFLQSRAAGWGVAGSDTAAAHSRLARSLAVTKALHDAGVPIVAGTDEGVPGFSLYRELELYVKAGFTPMEALRAATAIPARAARMASEVGTVEVGKRADLLVLDANPLDDIANIRTVRLVMARGVVFESAALFRAIGFMGSR